MALYSSSSCSNSSSTVPKLQQLKHRRWASVEKIMAQSSSRVPLYYNGSSSQVIKTLLISQNAAGKVCVEKRVCESIEQVLNLIHEEILKVAGGLWKLYTRDGKRITSVLLLLKLDVLIVAGKEAFNVWEFSKLPNVNVMQQVEETGSSFLEVAASNGPASNGARLPSLVKGFTNCKDPPSLVLNNKIDLLSDFDVLLEPIPITRPVLAPLERGGLVSGEDGGSSSSRSKHAGSTNPHSFGNANVGLQNSPRHAEQRPEHDKRLPCWLPHGEPPGEHRCAYCREAILFKEERIRMLEDELKNLRDELDQQVKANHLLKMQRSSTQKKLHL